jgi:hypothetical protein
MACPVDPIQGDQIGWFFAYWAVDYFLAVYFFLNTQIAQFWATFFPLGYFKKTSSGHPDTNSQFM